MEIKFEKILVDNGSLLNELYEESALTMEGLAEESIIGLIKWVNNYTKTKENLKVYIINGELMNSVYGLIGENSYSDDLTIVSIKLSDIENAMKIAIPRFEIGARWFDDIVDNNARRNDDM